jgi:pilus assembly protein Flp/PilA
VPVRCGNTRGVAGTDFTTRKGQNPDSKPNAFDYCWYSISKFRELYPEFKRISDVELGSKKYVDLPPPPAGFEVDPLSRSAALGGWAPYAPPQQIAVDPWTLVLRAAALAFGVPAATLVVGFDFGWVFSGFKARPSWRISRARLTQRTRARTAHRAHWRTRASLARRKFPEASVDLGSEHTDVGDLIADIRRQLGELPRAVVLDMRATGAPNRAFVISRQRRRPTAAAQQAAWELIQKAEAAALATLRNLPGDYVELACRKCERRGRLSPRGLSISTEATSPSRPLGGTRQMLSPGQLSRCLRRLLRGTETGRVIPHAEGVCGRDLISICWKWLGGAKRHLRSRGIFSAHGSKWGKSCVMTKIVAFLKNESGATAIEYGLIAAGISVAIIAIVNGLGTQLNTTFSSISTQLK